MPRRLEKACGKRVLVVFSANTEVVAMLPNNSFWGHLAGKKVRVHSGWQDVRDRELFHITWEGGKPLETIRAEKIVFESIGGSSFNIVDNLRRLGMTNMTLAPLVGSGTEGEKIKTYASSGRRPAEFISLPANVTAKTFIFQREDTTETVMAMVKPSQYMIEEAAKELLDRKWDGIIISSLRPDSDLLGLALKLFKNNPRALKSLIPSVDLVQNQDKQIRETFFELISHAEVFHLNDTEAGRMIGSTSYEQASQRELILEVARKMPFPKDGRDPRVVFVTLGSSGAAAAILARKTQVLFQPAREPWKGRAVSTAGLGDAFHSGVMRILLQTGYDTLVKVRAALFLGAEMAARVIATPAANLGQGGISFTPNRMVRIIESKDFTRAVPPPENF